MPLLLGALLLTMSALLLPNESLAQPRPDGIGVGMGFDVEYIAPQPFRDPGGKTSAWFPVKYVCGETQPGDRLVPGNYSTVINVLNLSKFIIRIGWWFSSGLGRAGIQGAQAEILGHASLFMDCSFIIRNLRAAGVEVGPFIEGFVAIEDLNDARPRRRRGQPRPSAHAAWGGSRGVHHHG
jgi:hypothetical protein